MIKRAKVIKATGFDPWYNLAVEEYLLDNVAEGECILYLWQNQNTVVIGKHQNPWKECRTSLLEAEGGKLARRLSGGGAVFHDLGNLNFTFLMNKADYNLEKQVVTILTAVKMLGINAEMTGRNDLTVDGRKFSGNAYCFRKNNAYHHGTILVHADMSKLSRYLQVSAEKMRSKGVDSVKSRVVNLNEFNGSLTIEETSDAMIKAFKQVYEVDAPVMTYDSLGDQDVINRLYDKYSSWEWRYGEAPDFDINLEQRFSWGGIELGLVLKKGRVEKAVVYSDAMNQELIEVIPEIIRGAEFKSEVLASRLNNFKIDGSISQYPGTGEYLKDIAEWLMDKGF